MASKKQKANALRNRLEEETRRHAPTTGLVRAPKHKHGPVVPVNVDQYMEEQGFHPAPKRTYRHPKTIAVQVEVGNPETLSKLWRARYSLIADWKDAARVLVKIEFIEGKTDRILTPEELSDHPNMLEFKKHLGVSAGDEYRTDQPEYVNPSVIQEHIDNGELYPLKILWRRRGVLIECWEDAARVFAAIAYLKGEVDEMQTPDALSTHPQIVAFIEKKATHLQQESPVEYDHDEVWDEDEYLTNLQIRQVIDRADKEELSELWNNRTTQILYRDDAAAVLAQMRFVSGIDAVRQSLDNVYDLEILDDFEERPIDDLEIDIQSKPRQSPQNTVTNLPDEPTGEKRRKETTITYREGQAKFRSALISYYGARCMITGETVAQIIEAAHIRPYDGNKTNHVTNGLLLRVDIHRLFDCGLLNVDPTTLKVLVDESLMSSSYGAYHNTALNVESPVIDREALAERLKASTEN